MILNVKIAITFPIANSMQVSKHGAIKAQYQLKLSAAHSSCLNTHVTIVWHHFELTRCFKSPNICENYTYIQTYIHSYMTRANFLSIVGLRLRAFGAQPPSELCVTLLRDLSVVAHETQLFKSACFVF